jgi:hypothetical protein
MEVEHIRFGATLADGIPSGGRKTRKSTPSPSMGGQLHHVHIPNPLLGDMLVGGTQVPDYGLNAVGPEVGDEAKEGSINARCVRIRHAAHVGNPDRPFGARHEEGRRISRSDLPGYATRRGQTGEESG